MTRARRPVRRTRAGLGGQHSWLEDLLQQQIALAGLPVPEPQYPFAREATGRLWRFDLAWPAQRVGLEVQGGLYIRGKHSRPTGQRKDAEKQSHAAILGWRVLVVTDRQITSGEALTWIERALAATTPS